MKLSSRQIHLDFHNSPFIPGILSDFDADVFAKTMANAHVNSVTVFARCIHGMAYYPTQFGEQHPTMQGRDFLGEAIEALHRYGIRAPIYVTVTWEEEVARKHPEWRQMYRSGRLATMNPEMDPNAYVPGSEWKLNDFIHPDHMDFIEAYLDEILSNYPVDGFFVDMVFYQVHATWSKAARALREKHGLMGQDLETHIRFESLAQRLFCERFTHQILGRAPKATVFYNTPNHLYVQKDQGAFARMDFQTHAEIESLPSGIWGYNHFPKIGRRLAAQDEKQWLGMTGRFQKMWGDFGGIKPTPALEYECFRTQALGGANSIGDQLLPNGQLDADAYSLIASVYKQCAEAEEFYEDSTCVKQIGILTTASPDLPSESSHLSEEGAIMLFEGLRYECACLDEGSVLEDYELIVMPDSGRLTPLLEKKLTDYLKKGGKVLASYNAGLIQDESWFFNTHGITCVGESEFYPSYWAVETAQLGTDLSQGPRVFYAQGNEVNVSDRYQTLVSRNLPYFQRSDLEYCSHYQAPPSGRLSPHPVCVSDGQIVYFADPIFREYRVKGNNFIKDVLGRILEIHLGKPRIGGIKKTVECYTRKRGKDLLLTLLHYLPVRKATECDVIEDSLSLTCQKLKLNQAVDTVLKYPEQIPLDQDADGAFILPESDGRLLLLIPNYWKE